MTDIYVEIAYARPERQYILALTLPEGSSIEQAILQSGILEQCKEISLKQNKVGIYSRPARLDDVLKTGDRIEIYRSLLIDPKELRRQRAERTKK